MLNKSASAVLNPVKYFGKLEAEDSPSPIHCGRWYTAHELDDGILYEVPEGALSKAAYLWLDLFFEGSHMAKHTFALYLREGLDSAGFCATYAVLPHCEARFRLPLESTNLNRVWLRREGALIKPSTRGQHVRLDKVDRVEIRINRIGPGTRPVRWCQSPVYLGPAPAALERPALPLGPLVDEFGQSTRLDGPGRVGSLDQLRARLTKRLAEAESMRWPGTYSRWGGDARKKRDATGFFRLEHADNRWVFVDPDGHPFWSAGMCSVPWAPPSTVHLLENAYPWLPPRDDFPEAYSPLPGAGETGMIDYLSVNLKRVFGGKWDEARDSIVYGFMRRWGFNTVGAFSEWETALRKGFPFTRMLKMTWPSAPLVFRDFPDVYDRRFERDARSIARQLEVTAREPAMVGYFLQNEPEWAFAAVSPAEGMLYNTVDAPAREALASWLRGKYRNESGFTSAWGDGVTLDSIRSGPWQNPVTALARNDLEEFSKRMINRLYRGVSEACRSVDPHHLNLGVRFPSGPRPLVLDGMRHVDVLSINLYKRSLKASPTLGELTELSETLRKPILVGEWHFGALDAALPGVANQNVRTQSDRAAAFRVYQEAAASLPFCVGTHYFRLQDNPAMGRFDGENYNIGFLDITLHPYKPLAEAARETHERLYDIVEGRTAPDASPPEYLGI